MKKRLIALCAAAFLMLGGSIACADRKSADMDGHQHADGVAAESQHADVKKHQSCPHCGMDREKFAHSRMLITYSDGSTVGVCSIHCAVIELKFNKNKPIKTVEVADFNTKKLVAVEKATWVIGGNKRGVMTIYAKWAFEKKDDAAAFIKKHYGKLISYKEALAYAEKD